MSQSSGSFSNLISRVVALHGTVAGGWKPSTRTRASFSPDPGPRQCRSIQLTMSIGSTYEIQGDPDGALFAYEQALRHNYQSLQALNAISCILRTKENFPRAVEYLQMMLKLDGSNGEVWGSLGE